MSSSNIAPAKKQTFSVAISTESYQNLIRNTLKDPKRANRFIASITSAVATTPAESFSLAAARPVLSRSVQAESQV